ncbi:MAG TPA: alpha/beta hydrolase, partial [Gammaproteobacteria bacterium]
SDLARVAAGAPGELLEEIDFLYCAQTRASAAAFVGYYADEPRRDTPGLLPRLPKPVLVIAGSADTVVPGLAQRVGPLADGTRVQFELVDGADHFFRDLYADDVADLAAGFIQAH